MLGDKAMQDATSRTLRAGFAAPLFIAMFALGALVGCQTSDAPGGAAVPSAGGKALGLDQTAAAAVGDADQFLMVDCLLPARVKRLGSRLTYLGDRRAIKTSERDCEIRGGEYVAYDRADYRTALAVWLQPAEEGDPKAQTYVGEILERGIGGQPDYAAAAKWYRRAADQRYGPAMINLGQLHEQGLGVEKDPVLALNLYRQAAGFDEAGLTFVTSADVGAELEDLRVQVTEGTRRADQLRSEIQGLQARIAELRRAREQAARQQAEAADPAEIQAIEQQRAALAAERERLEQERARAEATQAELERTKQALETERLALKAEEERLEARRQEAAGNLDAMTEVNTLLADLRQRQQAYQEKTQALTERASAFDAREAEIAEQAAGLEAREQQLAARETELARREQALEVKSAQLGQLEDRQAELETERQRLAREREQARSTQSELERMRQTLEAERQALEAEAAELEARRQEAVGDRQAMAEVETLLASLRQRQQAYEDKTGTLEEREAILAARETQLTQRESQLEAYEAELRQREGRLADREQAVDSKQAALSELDSEIATLRQVFEEQRQQLASLSEEQDVALAGPEIKLLDPQLPAAQTRGLPIVRTRAGVRERQIIGQVAAPAGLLSLIVNDEPRQYNDQHLFQAQVPVTPGGTRVSIVAVDRQGRRGDLEFVLAPQDQSAEPLLAAVDPGAQITPAAGPPAELPPIDFGQFHALVIGNNEFQHLPPLETAIDDAQAVADVLRSKYGFQVTMLENANRYQILSALNHYRSTLTEDDNLLIYYAGHGELDQTNMRGHWLPVDAEPDNSANWISNVAITDILNAMSAKRVLVVADSCYSGSLTRTALARLESGMSQQARVAWLKAMAFKRSRTALTSGGLAPTLDGGGGDHSVFANVFLEVLRENDGLIEGQRLFQEISARVTYIAQQYRFEQVPQYAPIKYAGHEAGEFFFVPDQV